jgi:hypothetical protein
MQNNMARAVCTAGKHHVFLIVLLWQRRLYHAAGAGAYIQRRIAKQ